MIRQIRTFQTVVRCGSFSKAADLCHMSQSAVSQQVQALENELGFPLLVRRNRSFSLTEAGAYIYRKSLILIADYDHMCREASILARGGAAPFRIGVLREAPDGPLRQALAAFASDFPDLTIETVQGSHEELFTALRMDQVDIAFSDQRRAFSDTYVNRVIARLPCCVEVSERSPLAALPAVTVEELKNTPCILIASPPQQDEEAAYYHEVIGFAEPFLFAESLDAARLLAAGGRGCLMRPAGDAPAPGLTAVPLYRQTDPVTVTLCAFWKKDRPKAPSEALALRLAEAFT